jgi:hypothetical protein
MLNEKVTAKVTIEHYFDEGKDYDLEDIYLGGTYPQYLVRGKNRIAAYFDAKLFTRNPYLKKKVEVV